MASDDFSWNPNDPLAMCDGESSVANAALRDYALLGAGRSQRALCEGYTNRQPTDPLPPTTALGTIKTWSADFAWVARVRAWTDLRDKDDEEEWAARRRQFRQEGWRDYGELRKLYDEVMQAAPGFVFERVVKAGKPQIVKDGKIVEEGEPTIVVTALNTTDLVRMRKLAQELGNEAIGKVQLASLINVDLSDLPIEALERLAAGEDPLHVLLAAQSQSGA